MVGACSPNYSGELLKPGGRRLQWDEMAPLHSSLSNTARLSQNNNNNKNNSKYNGIFACPLSVNKFLMMTKNKKRKMTGLSRLRSLHHHSDWSWLPLPEAGKAAEIFHSEARFGPGTVAHVYNPSTLRSQGRSIVWIQEFETSLGNIMRPVSTKIEIKN